MANIVDQLCEVVEKALNSAISGELEVGTIVATSEVNDPPEWDSLSFVEVFLAVREHFNLEVDDEDAVHFLSIKAMIEFMKDC